MMSALPCSGVRTTATAQRKLRLELRGLLRTQTVCPTLKVVVAKDVAPRERWVTGSLHSPSCP